MLNLVPISLEMQTLVLTGESRRRTRGSQSFRLSMALLIRFQKILTLPFIEISVRSMAAKSTATFSLALVSLRILR